MESPWPSCLKARHGDHLSFLISGSAFSFFFVREIKFRKERSIEETLASGERERLLIIYKSLTIRSFFFSLNTFPENDEELIKKIEFLLTTEVALRLYELQCQLRGIQLPHRIHNLDGEINRFSYLLVHPGGR